MYADTRYDCMYEHCGVTASSPRGGGQHRDPDPDPDRRGLLGAFLAAKARQAAAEEASSIEPRARSGLPRPSPFPGPAVVLRGPGSVSEFGLEFGLGSGLSPPPPPAAAAARTDQPAPDSSHSSDFLWASRSKAARTLTRQASSSHSTAAGVWLGGPEQGGRARSRSGGRRDLTQSQTKTLTQAMGQAPPRWPSRPKI